MLPSRLRRMGLRRCAPEVSGLPPIYRCERDRLKGSAKPTSMDEKTQLPTFSISI